MDECKDCQYYDDEYGCMCPEVDKPYSCPKANPEEK